MPIKTAVLFIQDRSGSMGKVWDETLQGYKAFLEDLRKKGSEDGVDYSVSLTVFDTIVEEPYKLKPIADTGGSELNDYPPRGMTALYDAVGQALEHSKDVIADKVVVVVVTDGNENSSREWNKESLQKVVESYINRGNWSFVYLGTQPETWGDAAGIGIGRGASANYVGMNARSTYEVTSGGIHGMSVSSVPQSRNLFQSHGDAAAIRSAGMKIQDEEPAKEPTKEQEKPKAEPKRWRK